MKVMGTPQTFTCPLLVVIRFLAPVIGGGAAATAAVLGDGRGLVDHSGEKKESGVLDILQFCPQAVRRIRSLRFIHDEVIDFFGDIDGVPPGIHGNLQMDLFRLRFDGPGHRLDRLGSRSDDLCPSCRGWGVCRRFWRRLLLYLALVQLLPGIDNPGRGEASVMP